MQRRLGKGVDGKIAPLDVRFPYAVSHTEGMIFSSSLVALLLFHASLWLWARCTLTKVDQSSKGGYYGIETLRESVRKRYSSNRLWPVKGGSWSDSERAEKVTLKTWCPVTGMIWNKWLEGFAFSLSPYTTPASGRELNLKLKLEAVVKLLPGMTLYTLAKLYTHWGIRT